MRSSQSVHATVAAFIKHRIEMTGVSQREVARICGYQNANLISMFKRGVTKVPVNRVPQIAIALEVAPEHLLELVMSEYQPETWKTIRKLMTFRDPTPGDDRPHIGDALSHDRTSIERHPQRLIPRFAADFLLSGTHDDLVLELNAEHFERLHSTFTRPASSLQGFATFRTTDGRAFALNMACVQGAKFQSDVAGGTQASEDPNESIQICLHGRPSIELSRNPLAFFDLINDLAIGVDPYIEYNDGEDRPWSFLRTQIVWVSGPSRLLDQGEQDAIEESGG